MAALKLYRLNHALIDFKLIQLDSQIHLGCRIHWCISAEWLDSSNECPQYDIKQSDGKARNAGALENTECQFMAIVPRFTLTWSGSSW